MGSIAVQAFTGLTDLVTATLVDLDGLDVEIIQFRPDGELTDTYVWLGVVIRTQRRWGDIGARQQKETLEIQCRAACWGGDWAPFQRFARAEAIVSAIDDAIRDQMDPASPITVFGIPAIASPRAMITTAETDAGDTDHGGTDAVIDFTVTIEANIYRTQEGP